MKKMLVIDGNSIVNRAFYGIRPLTTKEGLHTNAIYGFVNILLKNLQTVSPDYAAIAFDLKAPTFRHLKYAEYKAGRHAMPDELKMQMPYAKKTADALGFAVLEREGYEADDILGTLAAMGEREGIEVFVLTGDRDSLQLISDTTKVLLAGNADTVVFDREKFFEKYTIQPEQFVDLKALMGDSSDNIPGVPGVGEKTAIKLISAEGSLEGLYTDIENKDISASLKQKLITSKELAFLSQFLARIEKNAPLGIEAGDIEYKGFKSDELTELFTELEFFNFIKRLDLSKNEESVEYKDAYSLTDLDKTKIYAVDICDGKVSVVSENIAVRTDISSAYDFLADSEYKKILLDSKKTYTQLSFMGKEIEGIVFDVTLGAYLADSNMGNYDIEHLTSSFLNSIMKSHALVIFRIIS